LDGYDKEKNVVIEFDSKYHKYGKQKMKDLIRQEFIINYLKPKKFWRYDAINKSCVNVMERRLN
jgi:SET domain-containing protein